MVSCSYTFPRNGTLQKPDKVRPRICNYLAKIIHRTINLLFVYMQHFIWPQSVWKAEQPPIIQALLQLSASNTHSIMHSRY